jgi:hypothetical protein
VPNDDVNDASNETEPIDPGVVRNLAANDPGPIEVDVVMKNVVSKSRDPMIGRNLHMKAVDDDDI